MSDPGFLQLWSKSSAAHCGANAQSMQERKYMYFRGYYYIASTTVWTDKIKNEGNMSNVGKSALFNEPAHCEANAEKVHVLCTLHTLCVYCHSYL